MKRRILELKQQSLYIHSCNEGTYIYIPFASLFLELLCTTSRYPLEGLPLPSPSPNLSPALATPTLPQRGTISTTTWRSDEVTCLGTSAVEESPRKLQTNGSLYDLLKPTI